MSKGEMTRQRIIQLAAPLFNQQGYAGCSMQEILDATGLKKGGIYRHFSGKEELAAEAFCYALSEAIETRTPPGDARGNAVERLLEFVDLFVEKPSPVPGGCPILNTAIDSDDGNPVLRELVREGLKKWRDRIAKIVREGINRREIRKDVEPRALANTIIATLEGSLMISRIEGSRRAMQDAKGSLHILIANTAVREDK